MANIDTRSPRYDNKDMADRQTMNVSLPPAMEHFVRSQVSSGRYRSASEVVRDALRMLEEAEHRRLLEKWIYDDLTPEEEAKLPQELKDKAKQHFTRLVDDGIRSGEQDGWVDGPVAIDRIRQKLRARIERKPLG